MIKVIVAGDFAPRRRVKEQLQLNDFSCLDSIKPILESADYSIVNFESPVVVREAIPIEKVGPSLRCTESAMACVSDSCFRCVCLANNHFRDYGQIGVEDTLEACRKYAVEYVGGGVNLLEARKILYKSINGKTMAIINACEHEWSLASASFGGSNPMNIVDICRDIKEAKKNSNYVLLIIHGGTEHYPLPTPRMKDLYHFFVEQGVDAVVNHHQHCYSGYEVYKDKPIFYGLGNFCFDKSSPKVNRLWKEGYMVELLFDDSVSFRLHPYEQCTEQKASVCLLSDSISFDENISRLNSIIVNDEKLQCSFNDLAKSRVDNIKLILSPFSSRLASILHNKHLLPTFANKKRLKQLVSYVQCESHRDIMLSAIQSLLETDNNTDTTNA